MKKTIFTFVISLLVGFSLAIGIANYLIPLFWDRMLVVKLGFLVIIPLFWDRMLVVKLGFLVSATIFLGLLVNLTITKVIWLKFAGLPRSQRLLGIFLLVLCDVIILFFLPTPKMAIVHNTFKLQVLANQQGGS
ncbi:MAG: hypothetical protein ABSE06_08840, partial [Anaerolineaceae bacterium]